jgi:oligopeptide transport system substrate-binding protein
MRIILPVVLILGLSVAVALSTGSNRPRADFTFINHGSINILDPAQMSYMQDIRMAQAMWEGLTTLHPETSVAIEGAAYFPPEVSADKKLWRFTLRPEARWSNGDPLTTADYIRAWRRAIEPGTADVYAELITNHIAGTAEYAKWRTACTEAFSLMRQLQRGEAIKQKDAMTLLTGPFGQVLANELAVSTQPSGPNEADSHWTRLAQSLSSDSRDWRTLTDDLLLKHASEMEQRWRRVGVQALDDHRLEVRLSRPTTYFLDLTAFSTYLPVHKSIELLHDRYVIERGDSRTVLPVTDTGLWSYDPQWTKPDYHRKGYPGVICNGPYILKEWQFKQRMRFEANPMYWNAKNVRSKSVETIDIEYANTAFMVYSQKRADMMSDLTMDYTSELVKQARDGRRPDIKPIPCFGTYEYTFNCRPTLPDGTVNPLADPRVRRALTMAINKKDMVENAFPRLGNPVATTFVPRGSIPGYKSPAGLPYDTNRAREELAAAGFPGGRGFPVLPLLYNTGFNHELGAQAIKRMWERELGISVNLVGKETKTFAEDKVGGRFAISRGGWFGDYNDPSTFLDLYGANNGHNVGKWSDARYDALLAQAGVESDTARRMELLHEAERILVDEALPIIPLYQYVIVYAWRPNVEGMYPNPRLQFPMQYVYVKR